MRNYNGRGGALRGQGAWAVAGECREDLVMQRTAILVLMSCILTFGMLAIGRSPGAVAHEGTPEAAKVHPFAGTWMLDSPDREPGDAPEIAVVTSDGTYVQSSIDGEVGFGAWEATGESTAVLTLWFTAFDDDRSYAGSIVIRADIEVSADEQSWTGTYTIEYVDPMGAGTGQYGPDTATASRVIAEGAGEPVGPISEFGDDAQGATPEA
jgi:hypothetical protein